MLRTVVFAGLLLASFATIHPVRAQTASEVYPTISNPAVLQDFGGVEGIRALMEDFERELLARPSMRPFFANRDNTRLKALLVQQVCQILGGGCTYTGRTMLESHTGMGVTQAHFYALVEAVL